MAEELHHSLKDYLGGLIAWQLLGWISLNQLIKKKGDVLDGDE